jgi:hypothetical protein
LSSQTKDVTSFPIGIQDCLYWGTECWATRLPDAELSF